MNEPLDIIETASLTEKSSVLTEKQNKYVFRVRPRANKIQIKQAVERLFQKGRRREHLQLFRQSQACSWSVGPSSALEEGDRDPL